LHSSAIDFDFKKQGIMSMSRLSEDDVREIVEIIEEQLQSTQQIDRIQKMRMKTKIRHQAAYLRTILNPTPKRVLEKLKSKMPDVFNALPYSVGDTLQDFLDEKIRTLK
jgi:hypothetical protein